MGKKILTSLLPLLFSLGTPSFSHAAFHSLKEKFSQAQPGAWIVTAQEGNCSVLSVRSMTQDTLLLEEISVPEALIDPKKTDWKKWVHEGAPGHTSWTLYEIDRKLGTLVECFSISKNGWLHLDESELLFLRLLSLPLSPIPEADRKKIGPPPGVGQDDHRAPWIPPLIVEGVKVHKPAFDVVRVRWPEDGSRLSLCAIDLYFAKDLPDYPFPFWVEVHSTHYQFKMRAIDTGRSLVSPIPGPMPQRPPQILGTSQKGPDVWKLSVKSPPAFQKMHLFVIDLSEDSPVTIPIPCTTKQSGKKEEYSLEIKTSALRQILVSGHRYQWVIVPEGTPSPHVESQEIFTWHE